MKFETAAKNIKILLDKSTQQLTDNEILGLYGLYKQVLYGNNNTPKPNFWNITAKAKWESWTQCKGFRREEAEKEYIKYAEFLLVKYVE